MVLQARVALALRFESGIVAKVSTLVLVHDCATWVVLCNSHVLLPQGHWAC